MAKDHHKRHGNYQPLSFFFILLFQIKTYLSLNSVPVNQFFSVDHLWDNINRYWPKRRLKNLGLKLKKMILRLIRILSVTKYLQLYSIGVILKLFNLDFQNLSIFNYELTSTSFFFLILDQRGAMFWGGKENENLFWGSPSMRSNDRIIVIVARCSIYMISIHKKNMFLLFFSTISS